jgi:hypothetical protein
MPGHIPFEELVHLGDDDADLIRHREDLALRDLVRRFPNSGNQLEAALRAAYRRALSDVGVLPPSMCRENR